MTDNDKPCPYCGSNFDVGRFTRVSPVYGCEKCWKEFKESVNNKHQRVSEKTRSEMVDKWHNNMLAKIRMEKLEAL